MGGEQISTDIYFIHLHNDFSGSPRVLRSVIEAVATSKRCCLVTDLSRVGHLSGLPLESLPVRHRRGKYRLGTLIYYLLGQISLFRLILTIPVKQDARPVVYINTIFPFGAALAARVIGCKVIWHIHEVSLPWGMKSILKFLVDLTAMVAIFPSYFAAANYPLKKVQTVVLHNQLDPKIKKEGASRTIDSCDPQGVFVVLMLASLKRYKGVYEFFEISKLASKRSDVIFRLVANAGEDEILQFQNECSGSNFEVISGGKDVSPHLREANLVVNLSHPDKWIETFGLTLIEAFCFGLPVIAPTIGGPAEIVSHGENGFLLDYRHIDQIKAAILKMASDHHYWCRLSENARRTASQFADGSFEKTIQQLLIEA